MTSITTLSDDEFQQELSAGLLLYTRKPCLLCGRTPANGSAAWEAASPEDRLVLGAPPGKICVIIFALCQSCGEMCGVEEVTRKELLKPFISRS